MDEALKWLVSATLLLICFVGWLGGRTTRVAGRWRDDNRVIDLHQFGPWLSGSCPRPGGSEIYKGLALFGHVRLLRYVRGPQHLIDMGFTADVVPLLDGRAFANLKLRLANNKGDELDGIFEGRHFSFEYQPARIKSIARLEPQPRRWFKCND